MNIFGHEPSFWIAVGFTTLFKVMASENRSWKSVFVTVFAAILAAWLLTDAVLAWMEWDNENYKAPTAALIALVGENLMRWLIKLDAEKLIKLWKSIRS